VNEGNASFVTKQQHFVCRPVLDFDSRRGLGIFLFSTVYRPALGPTHPPIEWVTAALYVGLKRQGREANHPPPSSAEVKNKWSYTSIPQYVFRSWCLIKHRDNFTFLPVRYSAQLRAG
jgi:hypothetical protein